MSERDSFGARVGPITNPSFRATAGPTRIYRVTVYPRARQVRSLRSESEAESETQTGERRVTVDRPATPQEIKDIFLGGQEIKGTLAGK